MKKLISLLVVIQMVMLLFVPAFAEEFSLRNDIHFGDTKEQVRSKETIPIDEDAIKANKAADEGFNSIITERGVVAGINEVRIVYDFSNDDKLEEVRWEVHSTKWVDESDSIYEKLKNAMTSKYRTTLGYTNGDCYIITGKTIERAIQWASFVTAYGGFGDIRDYDEWDYEYQPGKHVKIEIVQSCTASSGASKTYYVNAGYKFFTDEDLTAAMAEKQAEHQKLINDI